MSGTDNNKVLTIVIPTYNRKERLLQQLKSIISQKGTDNINVLICDNCSTYSVEDLVKTEFANIEYIEVVRNKYNIGSGANIALTFLRCNTKWMWLLGDDDKTTEDSIETILSDIETFPNAAYFKYSIKGFAPYQDTSVDTIEGFIDYYYKSENTGGDMIFLSNNVYNLDIIGPCFKNTLMQSFFRIPHLMPVFNMLSEKKGIVMFRPQAIVEYLAPAPGTAWNWIDVSMGIATLSQGFLNIDEMHYCRLMKIIGAGFPHKQIAQQCLKMTNRYQARKAYCHIFNHLVIYNKRWLNNYGRYVIFHILYWLRIKIE